MFKLWINGQTPHRFPFSSLNNLKGWAILVKENLSTAALISLCFKSNQPKIIFHYLVFSKLKNLMVWVWTIAILLFYYNIVQSKVISYQVSS